MLARSRFCLVGCAAVVLLIFFVELNYLSMNHLKLGVLLKKLSTFYNLNSSNTSSQNTSVIEKVITRPKFVDDYVVFGGGFSDGRGLGNQLFGFAAAIYMAELTGRQVAMMNLNWKTGIEEVFDLKVERFDDVGPFHNFGESKSLTYETRIEQLARPNNPDIQNKSILVSRFFQSWKYIRSIDRRLRRHLNYLPEVQKFAEDFLERSVPSTWIKRFVRVGIHVRRGNVLSEEMIEFGYSTPKKTYFDNAMKYFVERYERVQFLACSNDPQWTLENIAKNTTYNASKVNVTYTGAMARWQHFAILAHCDHVIMSTGTYGWWAAWLAQGTTVYYKNWPIPNTTLYKMFKHDDFFPPSWIPME